MTSDRHSPPPVPAEDAARAFVDNLVELAKAGRFDDLCQLGGGYCESALAAVGSGTVPASGPTIVETHELSSVRRSDGTIETGGRIVSVCGLDQTGRGYLTEVLVFYDQGELRALNPIYWSGTRIDTTPTTPNKQQDQGCPGS
jgi:hypothetical protein